jgi:hypothetical protein
MPGTTPSHLRAVGIKDPYAIPHEVDKDGFASLDEIKKRFGLREKIVDAQKRIRERLD